ncbi:MAG: TetR/AcrR family transcriptional regulator [Lachnospiraceae bacterium]|nr:TetR/AcrR family transcriptional regulator [Lachnospiraceae bacterium]
MNEKFFDLKKEKQDRMLGAAFKAFATAGYAHASTDDIVHDASVSKGLLFHYFESKLGLYVFLYDYAVKFEQLEIASCVGKDETDYFEMRAQRLKAQANCMRVYPYLPAFLDRADREEDRSASTAVGAQIIAHAEAAKEFYARADLSRLRPEADITMIGRMLSGAFRLTLWDVLRMEDVKVPEEYYRACMEYLNMMRQLCYAPADGSTEEESL